VRWRRFAVVGCLAMVLLLGGATIAVADSGLFPIQIQGEPGDEAVTAIQPPAETITDGVWSDIPGMSATVTTTNGGILKIESASIYADQDAFCYGGASGNPSVSLRLVIDGNAGTGAYPYQSITDDAFPIGTLYTSVLNDGTHTVQFQIERNDPNLTGPLECTPPDTRGNPVVLDVLAINGQSSPAPGLAEIRYVPLLTLPAMLIFAFAAGWLGKGRWRRSFASSEASPPSAT
jgi:hypothetical protein